MDRFKHGKRVRLRCYNGKYLLAEEDKKSVTLSGNESDNGAIWKVELGRSDTVRFKSSHGTYLNASAKKLYFGEIGRKVTQSLPGSNSPTDWIPKPEGRRFKFETATNRCLRANGGFPWRNAVTHTKRYWSLVNEAYVWEVEFLEVPKPRSKAKVILGIIKDVVITLGAVVGAICSIG